MKSSDVGRRVVAFETEDKPGKIGTITHVFDSSFRLVTDKGVVYEFSTNLINVKFLGER